MPALLMIGRANSGRLMTTALAAQSTADLVSVTFCRDVDQCSTSRCRCSHHNQPERRERVPEIFVVRL